MSCVDSGIVLSSTRNDTRLRTIIVVDALTASVVCNNVVS